MIEQINVIKIKYLRKSIYFTLYLWEMSRCGLEEITSSWGVLKERFGQFYENVGR